MRNLFTSVGRILSSRIHSSPITPRPDPQEPAFTPTDEVEELSHVLYLMDPENVEPSLRPRLERAVAPLVANYLQDPMSVPPHLRELIANFITTHTTLQAVPHPHAPVPPARGKIINHSSTD